MNIVTIFTGYLLAIIVFTAAAVYAITHHHLLLGAGIGTFEGTVLWVTTYLPYSRSPYSRRSRRKSRKNK